MDECPKVIPTIDLLGKLSPILNLRPNLEQRRVCSRSLTEIVIRTGLSLLSLVDNLFHE